MIKNVYSITDYKHHNKQKMWTIFKPHNMRLTFHYNRTLNRNNELIWSGSFCTREAHIWTRINFTRPPIYSRLGVRPGGSRHIFIICIWSTSLNFLSNIRLWQYLSCTYETWDSWKKILLFGYVWKDKNKGLV